MVAENDLSPNKIGKKVVCVALDRMIRLYGRLLPNVYNKVNAYRYGSKPQRRLEIGCGSTRITDFETLNIVAGSNVDYVADASREMPFEDNTFDLIYASHVLEHIPWYMIEDTLREWIRILKQGGRLEIWVPDGLKICRTVVAAEDDVKHDLPDQWSVKNPCNSPYVWAQGRLFWGANPRYPSWHRALFTPKYLNRLFTTLGLKDVKEMTHENVRGYDHGWINLGVTGTKS